MRGVIIVGVDGSETSMRAGAYAVGLARRENRRLVGVFVRPLTASVLSFADPFGASIASAFAMHEAVETEFRDSVQRDRPGLDADFEIITRQGDPFAELCRAAAELWADAVIVGRSQSAVHRIAGSVAQRLVRCGRWPVTVVP
ncbi:universal stress protein [Actinoplanes sp. NPDC020271]|uniref:universal stress protein n=1 Tax=Actinoplanes sp. NPDC020271 TaxID=3363896 RepID=UPI0037ACC9CD